MTVSVYRVDKSDNIKVTMTYGPITAYVEENYSHLRSVWSSLGNLLDQMEEEKR